MEIKTVKVGTREYLLEPCCCGKRVGRGIRVIRLNPSKLNQYKLRKEQIEKSANRWGYITSLLCVTPIMTMLLIPLFTVPDFSNPVISWWFGIGLFGLGFFWIPSSIVSLARQPYLEKKMLFKFKLPRGTSIDNVILSVKELESSANDWLTNYGGDIKYLLLSKKT